jgi:hypothetical protein
MGLSCMLLLRCHLWRYLWLRNSNPRLTLLALNFRRMLPIFGIASWTHRLSMMMSRSRYYRLMRNVAMGVTAASWSHRWVNTMTRAWYLLRSWSWSCRRWHLVKITWWGRLFLLASVLIAMLRSRLLIRKSTYSSWLALTYWSRTRRLRTRTIRARFWMLATSRWCGLILIILILLCRASVRGSTLSNMTVTSALGHWCCPSRSIWWIFDQIIVAWRIATSVQLLLVS